MEPGALVWLGFGWWSLGTAVHWASAALARSPGREPVARHRARDFSNVAPLAGAEDATFPVPETLEMAAAIPGAATAVLDGVAHLAALENPHLVNALIKDFVLDA